MTVYEMRTYTLHVGKMTERGIAKLSSSISGSSPTMPTVARTGPQYMPTRTSSRASRLKFRPLVASQEVKLLTAAPWGPHP
jgi:hypothetical protein